MQSRPIDVSQQSSIVHYQPRGASPRFYYKL
jgi:hypothetical protein